MTADELRLADWHPRSQLVVPATEVIEPAFPVVDVHNHLGRWLSSHDEWLIPTVDELLRLLDNAGVQTVINLDGRWGSELEANLDRYDRAFPERFASFCHVEWTALARDDDEASIVSSLTNQLAESASAGARGVKVWKDLGLHVKDATGRLVMPNDPRVVAVLQAAGDLGLPILIHTADPVAFFERLDESNERWDELNAVPEWWFGGPQFPTFAELIGALDGLVGACPQTTFIGAHVGCWAEDLAGVGYMLHERPNWNVDLGGRLAEIGRQPRAFTRFVTEFPDRVLFGTDAFPPSVADYQRYYRFLETEDEHFPYSDEQPPPQGRWAISGCALPTELLEGLYQGNAMRLLRLG